MIRSIWTRPPLRCRGASGGVALLAVLCSVGRARAAPDDRKDDHDDHYISIHSETRADLFQRAALPGPGGAIIHTDTLLPIRETVLFRALDLDTPAGKDSVDVEVAGWAHVVVPSDAPAQSPDGDVQTANVRVHSGPVSFRLGRQTMTGGAARYVRFDGLDVDAFFGPGFEASAYGGFTALPRWNARPAYYNLGASSDVPLRDPAALPPAGRSGYVLGGARLGWSSRTVGAQLSFHEQHDSGELSHRSLGGDVQVRPLEHLSIFGDAVLELDAGRFSDARAWVDVAPVKPLDLSVEYRHTEPALLLARTSVLSVFSTSAYDETGLYARLSATRRVALDANGFIQIYDGGHPGARGEAAAKFVIDRAARTFVRLAYARLLAPDNGYNSVRASLSQRILTNLTGTLEGYFYVYDEAVRGYKTSSVFAGTLAYRFSRVFGVLWAGSLAQSPYSRIDAQTLVQLTCDFDLSGYRRTP